MKSIILGLCLIGSAIAQVPVMEKCPDVKVMQNFDINKYYGKWYEAERYYASFELAARCVTATYTAGENSAMKVLYRQFSALTGNESRTEGFAVQRQPEKAKFTILLPSSPRADTDTWVLDTDYTTYSIVWSCSDIGDVLSSRYAWILTRERFPSKSVMEKVYRYLEQNGIDRKFFMKTDQENCPPGFY